MLPKRTYDYPIESQRYKIYITKSTDRGTKWTTQKQLHKLLNKIPTIKQTTTQPESLFKLQIDSRLSI